MRGTLGVRGIATRTRAASALVCLLGLAVSCRSAKSPDDPFVGTWVVRADENPIFTVVVARRAGALGATLTTPNWQTRDGVTFTVQGTGAGTSEATAVIVRGPHHLHLRIDNPKNPTDTSEFDLALNDAQSGEMQYVGVPFPAWPLRKVPPNELPMPQVEWQAGRLYTIDMPAPPPNTEMAAIYDADQQDRRQMNPTHQDWSPVAKRDAARRAQTRALLAAGKLQAGVDYERAAVVFQHGTTAEDHLFAHVLALVALGKRDVNARWIAAATLDGYLAEIGKPQVFGARFNEVDGKAIVEEPFNRTLLSDDIRKLFDVPAIADQAAEYQKSMQAFRK